jgi:hypothetical protein
LFTHVGAVIVMGFFSFGFLVEPHLPSWFDSLRSRFTRFLRWTRPTPVPERGATLRPSRARDIFGSYLFVASILVFLVLASVYGWFWFLHYVTKSGPSASALSEPFFAPPALSNIPIQLWTLLLLFGPLLALPLLGREERWGMIPYLGVLMFTSQHGFWFPFRNQYPSLLIGPLFAATVRGLERVASWNATRVRVPVAQPAPPATVWVRTRARIGARTSATCGVVLLAIVAVGLFIAPWGPFNPALKDIGFLTPGYYNSGADFGTNLSLDAELRALAESVPASGVVLTQANLVEPLNREYYIIPSRFTTSVPLNYVLTDPYNPAFYAHNLDGPYSTSMLDWANYYIGQGWGVMGEVDGALLLAANFTGAPRMYIPVDQSFGGNGFACCGPTNIVWNGSRHTTWIAGPPTPYDGSYNVLSPGSYNITLSFSVDDPAASDRMQCQISSGHGQPQLWSTTISGATWAGANGTVQLTVPLSITSYQLSPRISLHVSQWTGPLGFVSVHIRQVSPLA